MKHAVAPTPLAVRAAPHGCVACASTAASAARVLSASHRVVRCDGCGLWYLHPRPQPAALSAAYAGIHARQAWGRAAGWRATWRDRVWDAHGACRDVSALWKLVPRRALSVLLSPKDGTRVLDVGFGRGVLLDDLKARGFEPWGLEVSHAAVARARAHGHRAEVGDIENPGTLAALPPASFDAIVLNHVLEHLAQPRVALSTCRMLLKANGRLVVAIPNASAFTFALFGKDWYGSNLPHHLAFYTPDSARCLVEQAEFVVEQVQAKNLLWYGPDLIRFYLQRAPSWSLRVRFLWQLLWHCVPGRITGCETITLYCRVR
ncbi:MAG: class I SAM-dependent methyltransferase [Planctomycetota bacterium]